MISGIILASGFSKRMKKEKLLLPLSGIPIVEHVIRAAHSSHLDEVILIYRNERVKEIGTKYLDKIAYNDKADQGQSAAVKLGIKKSHKEAEAFMFLVGDQPFLSKTIINVLIDIFKEAPGNIVAPVYNGKKGSPVIFPVKYKNDLISLSGDTGGRIIIEKHNHGVKLVEIENTDAGIDIDNQEEYDKIIR